MSRDTASCATGSLEPSSLEPTGTLLSLWIWAGVASGLACLASGLLLHAHLRHFVAPQFQRHICRILVMVPLYALSSFLSLRYYRSAVRINIARDMYEGFVVYSLFRLCLEYMGPTPGAREALLAAKQPRRLSPPACCLVHQPAHEHFLDWCRLGILQYGVCVCVCVCVVCCAHGCGTVMRGTLARIPIHARTTHHACQWGFAVWSL
jgi:hypothetical protein